MLESRPRLKKFLGAALRYVAGIAVGLLLATYMVGSSGVPYGTYAPLYSGQGASFQVNATNGSEKDGALELWIREDRNETFVAESGINGRTIYSRVFLTCAPSPAIQIVEQRSFDALGRMTNRATGHGPVNDPNSLMSLVVIVKMCGIAHPDMMPNQGAPQRRQSQPSLIA